jgi:hypothetical protein
MSVLWLGLKSSVCAVAYLYQLGTLLYVILEVTSNMMIAHWPWMLQVAMRNAPL